MCVHFKGQTEESSAAERRKSLSVLLCADNTHTHSYRRVYIPQPAVVQERTGSLLEDSGDAAAPLLRDCGMVDHTPPPPPPPRMSPPLLPLLLSLFTETPPSVAPTPP